MNSPRDLTIVCVDDDEESQDAIAEYQAFFEIIPLTSSGDACQELVKQKKEGLFRPPIDLFLLDVNMAKREGDHGFANWGTGITNIVPYGPMLALPFLNTSALCQFEPYSIYWDYPEVNKNGYVLLSLAFLLTAIRGKEFSLEEVHEELLSKRGQDKIASEALVRGLDSFRRRIEKSAKDGEIILHDIPFVSRTLRVISENSVSLPILLPGGSDPLSISWTDRRSGEVEHIHLTSLFADILEFNRSPSKELLLKVAEALDMWEELSVPWKAVSANELYNAALEVLKACAKFRNEGNKDHLKKLVTEHPLVVEKNCNEYQLLRTVILFTWTIAWRNRIFMPRREPWKTVTELIYNQDGKPGLKRNPSADPDTKNSSTFYKEYERFFAEPISKNGRQTYFVSKAQYRTPFQRPKAHHRKGISTREHYLLTDNDIGLLTRMEMELCQQFARQDLHVVLNGAFEGVCTSNVEPWDARKPNSRPYPTWMTKTEKLSNAEIGTQTK